MVTVLWMPVVLLTVGAAVVALLRRHWWPAAALGPVALLTLVPELWVRSKPPADHSQRDGALRVATVNLQGENLDDPLMEESLHQIDADVLVLLEFTTSWAERLEAWLPDDYPYRWLAAAPDRPGYDQQGLRIAIWSRLPAASDDEVLNLRGWNSQIRVPLVWRGRAFALYGIHPSKPYPYRLYAGAWRERQQLLDWIRSERLPTVVAGDFNASPRSAFLQRLRLLGLDNASESVCGRAPTTWPMHPDLLAPLRIAIDHLMHSEALIAVDFRRGMLTHSDHAPVYADLVWRNE